MEDPALVYETYQMISKDMSGKSMEIPKLTGGFRFGKSLNYSWMGDFFKPDDTGGYIFHTEIHAGCLLPPDMVVPCGARSRSNRFPLEVVLKMRGRSNGMTWFSWTGPMPTSWEASAVPCPLESGLQITMRKVKTT